MFVEERFKELLANFDLERITRAYFTLQAIEEANKTSKQQGLPTVTSGKYVLLAATSKVGNEKNSRVKPVEEQAAQNVRKVMSKWRKFLDHVQKLKSNAKYNGPDGFNFDGYYKGSTVATDLLAYDLELSEPNQRFFCWRLCDVRCTDWSSGHWRAPQLPPRCLMLPLRGAELDNRSVATTARTSTLLL